MTPQAKAALRSMHERGFVDNRFKEEAFAFALLEWRRRALLVIAQTPGCDIAGAYAKAALDWSPSIFTQMLRICEEWGLPTKMDVLHRAISRAIGAEV